MRLKTHAKKKLKKALTRVEKVVIMDVSKMLEDEIITEYNNTEASTETTETEDAE